MHSFVEGASNTKPLQWLKYEATYTVKVWGLGCSVACAQVSRRPWGGVDVKSEPCGSFGVSKSFINQMQYSPQVPEAHSKSF